MKKLSLISSTFGLYLLAALPAFAATTIDPCPNNQTGSTNFRPLCDLRLQGGLVSNVITIAFIIATLIALGFLIYGGIRWILSGGDKAGVEAARNTIVAALVGLVIVFLSYFILRLVFSLFGIDLGNLTLPDLNVFKK